MTIAISKSVNFGDTYGGLGTVGFTLYNDDGTVFASRSTSGVFELVANQGIYSKKDISITDTFKGSIVWDTGGGSPVYAVEEIDYRSYTATSTGGGQSGGGGMLVVHGQWERGDKEKLFLDLENIIASLRKLLARTDENVLNTIESKAQESLEQATKIKEAVEAMHKLRDIKPEIVAPAPIDLTPLTEQIQELSTALSALLEYHEVKQMLTEVNNHVDQIG